MVESPRNSNESDNSKNGSNTANKKIPRAERELQNSLTLRTDKMIQTQAGADSFLKKTRTVAGSLAFARDSWQEIQKIAEFSDIELPEKTLKSISKKIVLNAQRKIAMHSRKRGYIMSDYRREYELSDEDALKIETAVANHAGDQLGHFNSFANRKTLVDTLFWKNTPLRKPVQKRMIEALGPVWDELYRTKQYDIIAQLERGTLDRETLEGIWNKMGDKRKVALLQSINVNFDLSELAGMDSVIFGKDILLDIAKNTVSRELKNMGVSQEKREEACKKLDWSDVSGMNAESADIIKLARSQDYGYSTSFMSHLTEFINEARVEELEARVEKVSEDKIKPQEILNEDFVSRFSHIALEKEANLAGQNLLLSENFQRGKTWLILTLKDESGAEKYFEVLAGRQPDDQADEHPIVASVYVVPLSLDENAEKASAKNNLIGLWELPLLLSKKGSAEFQSETAFYQAHKLEVPTHEVSSEEIDRTEPKDKEATKSVNAEEENPEETTPKGSSIEEAKVTLPDPKGDTLSRAREILGYPLTPEVGDAIWEAHQIGGGQYTPEQLKEKVKILKEGWGLAEDDCKLLIEQGLMGTEKTETPAGMSTEVQSGLMIDPITGERRNGKETIPLETLEQLNYALGKHFNTPTELKAGCCVSIGMPSRDNYNVFRVTEIVDGCVHFDDKMGNTPKLDFKTLYDNAFTNESFNAKVISEPLDSPENLLFFVQENSTQKDMWSMIELRQDEKTWKKVFDFLDRRFDDVKYPKRYFSGRDGRILEIVSIDGGIVTARTGSDYDEGEQTANWGEVKDFPIEYLAHFILRFSLEPQNKPPREVGSKAVKEHTEHGWLKHIFWRLSVHDIMSGGKKFIEEFKHHLEHGNHMQEQRVMLGIAKRMGMDRWNAEWYADFKSKYENEEKGLIEKRLETLGKMGSPMRQWAIRASLLNDGTHNYDHWTNAICMLEKHGTLYSGQLQDLEGTWIFFRRIAGIPLTGKIEDYKEYQNAVKVIRGKGVDAITEEAVIEEYMKLDPHFPNSLIWRMIKNKGKAGRDEETKNGETEALEFNTLDQRVKYTLGKLKSKEYAHAIGWLKTIFEKDGPAYKKQTLSFILAMTRIPERLPRKTLDEFVQVYDVGHIHSPALMFIKDRTTQELFRETIGALVREKAKVWGKDTLKGKAIVESYQKMMKAIGENQDIKKKDKNEAWLWDFDANAFVATENFWNTYGPELQHELTVQSKNDAIMLKNGFEQTAENRPLFLYNKRLRAQMGDATLVLDKEVDRGTPFSETDSGASAFLTHPGKVIDQWGMQPTGRGFETTGMKAGLQASARYQLGEIRDKDASILSIKDKENIFRRIYAAYTLKIQAGGEWEEFYKQDTVRPFTELWLEPPPLVAEKVVSAKIAEIQKVIDAYVLEKEKLEAKKKKILEAYEPLNNQLSKLQSDPTKNDAEIQRVSQEIKNHEESMKEIQGKIGTLEQSINREKSLITVEEQKRKRRTKYDETDPDHNEFFNRCFERFLNSGKSVTKVNPIDDVMGGTVSAVEDAISAESWTTASASTSFS